MATTTQTTKIKETISRTGGSGDGGGDRPPSSSGLSDDGGFSDGSRDTWRPAAPGGWTERRERGNKPEKFQGDRDKSEAFLLNFSRYLHMNEQIYPTESDRVDLFLSFIDHPWSVN